MAYPTKPEVIAWAQQAQVNPMHGFAFAAMCGALPHDLPDFQRFLARAKTVHDQVDPPVVGWCQGSGSDGSKWPCNFRGSESFVSHTGRWLSSAAEFWDWMRASGAQRPDGSFGGNEWASLAENGGFYPPATAAPATCEFTGGINPPAGGGSGSGSGGGGTTPPAGGDTTTGQGLDVQFSKITDWVKAHKLESAAIGIGAFLVLRKGKR